MPKQRKPLITLRKTPTQARAQETVGIILEASAQILQKEGEAALTTNRIAAHAGFSIGTLYQYFPNRESILAAMATREQAHILAKLEIVLARLDPTDPEPTVRDAIAALLGAFRGRHGVRRAVLLGVMRRMPDDPRASAGVAEPLLTALETRCAGYFTPLGEAGRFVLLRAIAGAVRAAAIERSPLLGTPPFEDALVRLVLGMLRAGGPGRSQTGTARRSDEDRATLSP
jgi:AcrR family transcriptional regulator